MSSQINSLLTRLSRLNIAPFKTSTSTALSRLLMKPDNTIMCTAMQRRSFVASSVTAAKAQGAQGKVAKPKKGKKSKGPAVDPRILNLKISMPRKVPAPLRFARNRHLRHWTIHRAWMLWQRQERENREKELMRMYQSMHSACEELRKTSGPGNKDEGYLYRVAMEKKGLFSHNSIPIEYTKPQTETPARIAWNHDWTR
ncbi:hypothetical protein BX600DRAFT_442261 [Xylariales sp. PMI_506]|nr:hypothetical protein BX600DRAFT_442261 [Xylariales sp. PMI_506]